MWNRCVQNSGGGTYNEFAVASTGSENNGEGASNGFSTTEDLTVQYSSSTYYQHSNKITVNKAGKYIVRIYQAQSGATVTATYNGNPYTNIDNIDHEFELSENDYFTINSNGGNYFSSVVLTIRKA